MTVTIYGDIRQWAQDTLALALRDRPRYCHYNRSTALDALIHCRPAYIQLTEYDDQWSANAAIWANGGLLGVAIDPPQPLCGLRAVLRWRRTVERDPERYTEWLRHVVRHVQPINAEANLDMELLRQEFGLSAEETA